MADTTSLGELQTEEQRRVLDVVHQVRNCGLDGVVSLPQIVVCGDQSSGKSSVLEALTEIPFPRADNICTRFATEISLIRASTSSLTVKIIPDDTRPQAEQEKIRNFTESITDFKVLPTLMGKAMNVMGISDGASAIARDILSIEIQGPDRPQLTLVDIPGLVHSATKGVSDADVTMISDITDHYIKQPRTICLAVISATNDAANQSILQRVRKFDPKGERTLGVITKPDLLPKGSGSEAKFLELARNEDVVFSLGWHVVKNRKFEETDFSIEERNFSEKTYFNTSNFKKLPKTDVGIDTLRLKLSQLLFEHIKNELPRIQSELESALTTAADDLESLGQSRSTVTECRNYMAQLNMKCYELCKAGVSGHYEDAWFQEESPVVQLSKIPLQRLRAVVQWRNKGFADRFRKEGHKYEVDFNNTANQDAEQPSAPGALSKDAARSWADVVTNTAIENSKHPSTPQDFSKDLTNTADQDAEQSSAPKALSKDAALSWVKEMLQRSRGTELQGTFNPNLIAELFWEQSEAWGSLSKDYINLTCQLCENFVSNLLDSNVPMIIKPRIWQSMVRPVLRHRRDAAFEELEKLLKDRKDYPINYNHYYTDIIVEKRKDRIQRELLKHAPKSNNTSAGSAWAELPMELVTKPDEENIIHQVVSDWGRSATEDMEEFSCEEALDSLLAIYKVLQKTFIANITTQVIERHLVRGLQDIFSPMVALNMPDAKVESMVSEPTSVRRQRVFLTDRIKKLEEGQEIFRTVLA
ncbi:Interferon-induced GTP-binding protein Mx [Cytospora mali]|uniref:Interferon-induced GTP-binding protein Mx n=1 Tax=Cytospora mali TaxID=578113 RepID=A0A194V284_CYTMA|nr:Interferon-induced GTP-binding protein Mx [Valsa mali var. pyri (nom. inval.)]